jgi:pantothenate kinase-related protein Tda10
MGYRLTENQFIQLERIRAQLDLMAQLGSGISASQLTLTTSAFASTMCQLNEQMLAIVDQLVYEPLQDKKPTSATEYPLIIDLIGNHGAGKSTLMRFIGHQLKQYGFPVRCIDDTGEEKLDDHINPDGMRKQLILIRTVLVK